MKKILLFLGVLCISFGGSATTPVISPRLNAADVFIPIGNTGKTISLLDLSRISVKEVQELSGHRMKFGDRLGFSVAQRRLRNLIDYDGTVNTKKLQKLSKKRDGEDGFHIGGFALGFFLGVIGVLIAYFINDDYKRNRVKWAWLGFAASVAIALAIVASVGTIWY